MKKILILGASGMAGHMIYYYFSSLKKYHIFTVCHTMPLNENSFMLDIYNTEKLTKILIDTKPDIIINCIGVLIKGAQKSIENTVYINAYYPHLLVHIIEKDLKDVKLIHISTDCVFSGKKGNYTVDDIRCSQGRVSCKWDFYFGCEYSYIITPIYLFIGHYKCSFRKAYFHRHLLHFFRLETIGCHEYCELVAAVLVIRKAI